MFMQYIKNIFFRETRWNEDNSYEKLDRTARDIIDFQVPNGVRLILSSLATRNFATSYQFGAVGVVDGSISYLYSSVPLGVEGLSPGERRPNPVIARSERIPLPALLQSYGHLHTLKLESKAQRDAELARQSGSSRLAEALRSLAGNMKSVFFAEVSGSAKDVRGAAGNLQVDTRASSSVTTASEMAKATHKILIATQAPPLGGMGRQKSTLLYGRLYLPQTLLEAQLVRRLTPSFQLQALAVSDQLLRNGGTLLGVAQYDTGKYGFEGLLSTDGGLLGMRGLYNFGGDASLNTSSPERDRENRADREKSDRDRDRDRERIYGRFSCGGELYYGTLNKSGGMSLAARFATLPAHRGTPLTAVLMVNPLMGNIATTYSVAARRPKCAFSTRFEYNVYSYESAWAAGIEIWTKSCMAAAAGVEAIEKTDWWVRRSFDAKMEWRLDEPEMPAEDSLVTYQQTQARSMPRGEDRQIVLAITTEDAANSGVATKWPEGLPGVDEVAKHSDDDEYTGVVKARLDQNLWIGLLWEGRFQSLIFSLGTAIDLQKLGAGEPFRRLGLNVHYSS